MGSTITAAEWQLVSENRDTLPGLLELEPGWATTPEILYSLAPSDPRERGRTRRVLTALARLGVLECMSARHQGEPLAIYNVDHEAIDRTIAELAVVR